jgi:hypothetical protein
LTLVAIIVRHGSLTIPAIRICEREDSMGNDFCPLGVREDHHMHHMESRFVYYWGNTEIQL